MGICNSWPVGHGAGCSCRWLSLSTYRSQSGAFVVHDAERRREVDAISYGTAITACTGAGNGPRAEHWRYMLLAAGVEASVFRYSSVAEHVLKHVMWPEQSMGYL